MDEPAVSSNARNRDPPRGNNPAGDAGDAQEVVDRARARRDVELAAQHEARQLTPVRPTTSVEPGVTSSSLGVPCLVPALRKCAPAQGFQGPAQGTKLHGGSTSRDMGGEL